MEFHTPLWGEHKRNKIKRNLYNFTHCIAYMVLKFNTNEQVGKEKKKNSKSGIYKCEGFSFLRVGVYL